MINQLTEAVEAVSQKNSELFIVVTVVSPKIEGTAGLEATPMTVSERPGDTNIFPIVRHLGTFDTTKVSPGDSVLIGRLLGRQWIAIDKVVS